MEYELPPDYEERKCAFLKSKGLDPLVDDIDLDTMSVVPRKEKPAGELEAFGTAAAYNLPETASSLVGARGGAALVTGLASLLRKAPHPALKILGTVGGALAAPALTSRFTQPIKEAISPGVTERLDTMRMDSPWSVAAGAQASALPFMRYSNPLKAGAANLAAGAGVGAGVPLAQQLDQHENIGDIDVSEVVSGGVGGLLLNNPTRLGTWLSGIRPTIIPDSTKSPVASQEPTTPVTQDPKKQPRIKGQQTGQPPIPGVADAPFDTGEQQFQETGFEGWKPPVEEPLPLKQPQESADWETQGGAYEQPDPTAPKPIQVDTTKVGMPENKLGGPENWKGAKPINFQERGLPPEAQESISGYNEDAKTMYSGVPLGDTFKRWFGKSKIVDEKTGEPKKLYHVTKYNFDEFRPDINSDTELGTHVGSLESAQNIEGPFEKGNIDGSRSRKVITKDGGRVMPLYVKMENPVRMPDIFPLGNGRLNDDLIATKAYVTDPKVRAVIDQHLEDTYSGLDVTAKDLQLKLRELGYDGVVYWNEKEGGGDSYIVFDPQQIKSATGNKGTFDPADPDIRHSGFPGFGSRRVKSNYGPQDDPQITPRAGWNPLKSEVDKLRAGGPLQTKMADSLDVMFNKRREFTGRYANPIIGAFEKLQPEAQQRVYDTLIKEDRAGQDLSAGLDVKEKAAYQEIRSTLKLMAQEQQAAGQMVKQNNGMRRARGMDPFYAPNIIDRTVHRILSEGQGTKQFQDLKKEFIKWQTQHGISNAAADERFAKLLGSFETSFNDNQFAFGSVREPEGIGLPDSWIERDPIHAMRKYVNRFAKDRAFYDVIETNPEMMRMLGSDSYKGGISIPQNIQTENLAADKQVRNILNNYSGADQGGQEPVISGIGRVVNAAILSGPITKLTDIGTVPFKALAYVPTGHEGAILKGIADWRQGYKDAFDHGFNRRGGQVVMQDMLGIGEKAADTMSQIAESITKITGSEQLELLSRGLSQSIGNFIAEAHVGLAKQGNQKSIKFLEKLGKDWQTQSPKELGTRVGQLLQGRYDITNLPRWAIDSPYAPFLGMMKWSVEQTNNFIKHVVEPARQDGDFAPFIKTLIGGLGGGLVLNEMREKLSGKKPYVATWKELEAGKDMSGYKDALTYKMIGAAQVTGTAGILAEILRQVYELATDRMPQGFRYPVFEVGKDTVQRMFAGAKAIAEGEDPWKVTGALTKDLLTRHVQMARIIKNQLGKSGEWKEAKEDIDRSNMMRDEDTYNRMAKKPQAAKVQTPPSYSRLTEKEFDKEENLNKAASLVPGLVKRGVERAGGDPATLQSEMRKLSTIDVRGMPSPDRDPVGFAKYYNWLRDTQGDEKARQFTSEFMKRRALAEAKRGMIPKIEAR